MQRREWYMIDYDAIVGSKGDLVYYTYEAAKAKAGKYPVRKVVVDETWEEPEKEWSTPIDSEATTRPMVEVRQSEHEPWRPAILLAVRQQAIRSYPPGPESVKYIAIESSTDQLWWNQCRIHKHEVELIYGSRKDKR
jgi:hypothetical protein